MNLANKILVMLACLPPLLACQSSGGNGSDAAEDVQTDPSGDPAQDDPADMPDVPSDAPGDPDADVVPDVVPDIVDTLPPPDGAIIIDHNSVALFDTIPDSFIEAASALSSLFLHASVGGTINTGLDCLAGNLETRAYCESISEPEYDRSAWVFQAHANGSCMGKLQDLVDAVPANPGYNVYHQKYCYFEGLDSLGDNCCGVPPTTETTAESFDAYVAAMNGLEAANPGAVFVWWTTPYVQNEGHVCANDWNTRMRAYARENGKVLFDIGDIETCSPDGVPTLVDGLEAAFPPYCGEETGPSCHPDFPKEGSGPDGGNVRLAKAWWVMMARIAGWEP